MRYPIHRHLIFDFSPNISRNRNIIRARAAGETLKKIGQDYGLTPERIRQIESRCIRRIRRLCEGGNGSIITTKEREKSNGRA